TAALAADTSYTVYVWIPGGDTRAVTYAHFAHYVVMTESGAVDYVFDQESARNGHGNNPKIGGWYPLATGIRFLNGAATVTLDNGSAVDALTNNVMEADAIQ